MTAMPRQMDAQDWAMLILLSVLWGGAFFFAGVAVRELPPLTVVLVRVGVAALTLLPLFLYLGHRLPGTWAEWVPFVGMGLLNNVLPFGLIFAGQTQIGVGLSAVVNSMTPLFTVLVMAGFREERLTALRAVGVIVGIVGVAILNGGGTGQAASLADARTLGIALCMTGALSYGFAALWGRRRLSAVAPVKSATCQLICSTVMMTAVVAAVDRPWSLPMPSAAVVWSLLMLAVFGTALAYLVFFRILVRAGAGNVMLVTLLIPVTAIALGALFLGEDLTSTKIAGALVIGLGLMFLDGRAFGRAAARLRSTS